MGFDDVQMRWAVPSDAATIAQYHHACWEQAFAPLVSDEVMEVVQPRLERWTGWLGDDSDFVTVVAVDDSDQPIGHTTVLGRELVHLFIDPRYWRRGVGRQLLAVGERLIRQAGYRRAELHTIVGNTAAITLYQRCGWTRTDEVVHERLPNGATYPEHVMVKDLAVASHVEVNRESWDRDAHNWVERGRRSWAAVPHWGEMAVAESDVGALPPMAGLDVVELGCGTGYVAAWCLRRGAATATGIDNSLAQLSTARRLQDEFGLSFPLVWGNAECLPFADESFDVAITEYGASLWCQPALWIAEAARVLRPGGKLMFLTRSALLSMCAPDFEHEPTSAQLLRAQADLGVLQWPDVDGVEFSPSHGEWIALLTGNGFRVDRLIELYAPATGPERYSYFDAAWARQWPAEEIWCATYAPGPPLPVDR